MKKKYTGRGETDSAAHSTLAAALFGTHWDLIWGCCSVLNKLERLCSVRLGFSWSHSFHPGWSKTLVPLSPQATLNKHWCITILCFTIIDNHRHCTDLFTDNNLHANIKGDGSFLYYIENSDCYCSCSQRQLNRCSCLPQLSKLKCDTFWL